MLRIINEPTAAGLAYGFENPQCGRANGPILMFDWGGGTLDVSILRIKENRYTVVAVAGGSHLGGADFDCKLADHMAQVRAVLAPTGRCRDLNSCFTWFCF